MSRLSRNTWCMGMARLVSLRGTCDRLKVGAVLFRESRAISSGYNGPPSGMPHCDHGPGISACEASVHAELNAILFAARNGVRTEGATLYVTHMPCLRCAQAIINAGISEVIYDQLYRDPSGVDLLEQAGVRVCKFVP